MNREMNFSATYGMEDMLNSSTSQMETNFMKEVQGFLTFQIASFIAKYWLPTLVPIGLIGNTLSFMVMIKPNNRRMSTCIYMAAISVNDNLMNVLGLYTWLVAEVKIHDWIPVECDLIAYFVLLTLQNSTYQVLAMTIDKYIAIKWPHKAAVYSTPRRAKITVVVLYICIVIYNSPHLVFSGVIGTECLGYAVGGILTKMYSWTTFVLNAIIPFSLLIYMNYVITKTVRKSRNMFKGKINQDNNQQNSVGNERRQKVMKSAENQLTIMLLLVTTLFLVLLIPTYVRFMYLTFVKPDTPEKHARLMLFYHISHKLYNTNNGINFFLYCISGRKFRNDLKELLCGSTRRPNSYVDSRSTHSRETNTEVSTIGWPNY